MSELEQLAAFLTWCEVRAATLEVYPGDALNPRLSGWTARVRGYVVPEPGTSNESFDRRVDAVATPHAALVLLARMVMT